MKFIIPGIWCYGDMFSWKCNTRRYIYIYIIVWNLDCSTLYESLVSKMEMEDIFHSWIFLDEVDRRAWYFSYIVNDKYSLKNNSGNLFSKKKFINCAENF